MTKRKEYVVLTGDIWFEEKVACTFIETEPRIEPPWHGIYVRGCTPEYANTLIVVRKTGVKLFTCPSAYLWEVVSNE